MKKIVYTLILWLPFVAGCQSDTNSLGPKSGKGGSMARFAITGNALYIVDDQKLSFYDISSPDNPVMKGEKHLGFGIETIYPYQNNLFIGARDGMHIFDNSTPGNPSLLSSYWHIQSCDPVVVQDNYAYVTLRSGASCRPGNTGSSLDVVDISDLKKPVLIGTQEIGSPYGLAVSGKTLFVCDGDYGLKTYTIEDPRLPVLAHSHPDIPAYDVIVRNENSLILTGAKGLYQFHFGEDPESLELLSLIPVR